MSIREVAARAGVSLGTVSKVLNDSANAQIALPTREKVRHAALELGYHPSAVARALVRRQMDTIGVVLPPGQASPIRAPFFSILFDAVLNAAAHHHQNTTIFTGHTWKNATTSLSRFRDGRCDGLLLFYQPEKSDIFTSLLDAGVPVVLVNDVRDDPRLSWVDVDNHTAAHTMTEHLLQLGHRRIGMILAYPQLNYVAPRITGYRDALEAAGIGFDPALVPYGTPEDWAGNLIEIQLSILLDLPEPERPTALFCLGDDIASQVIYRLTQCGLRVPEDISVAGFNDDGAAQRQIPSLTTMRQPYDRIAHRALEMLLEQVQDIRTRGKKETLPAQLVIRDSTAPPPH